MATMVSEVYDALREAGASEEKARKAAEVLASYDSQFAAVRTDIADLRGSLRLVQAMLGLNLTLTAGVLWRLLAH
jgi:hypothetical protein